MADPVSIGGGVRARIVSGGAVAGRVFRDRAPENCTLPYVTFTDPISRTAAMSGDAVDTAFRRQIQVDYWERLGEESPETLQSVVDSISGGSLTLASGKAYGLRVIQVTSVPDPDASIAHQAITVSLVHGTEH